MEEKGEGNGVMKMVGGVWGCAPGRAESGTESTIFKKIGELICYI